MDKRAFSVEREEVGLCWILHSDSAPAQLYPDVLTDDLAKARLYGRDILDRYDVQLTCGDAVSQEPAVPELDTPLRAGGPTDGTP